MAFRGAYRLAKAQKNPEKAPAISKAEATKAEQAMKGLNFLTGGGKKGADEEEIALTGVKSFVHALRGIAPEAVFTSADLVGWAKNYYGEANPPEMLTSPQKATFLLRANTALLGIEPNGKGFALGSMQ